MKLNKIMLLIILICAITLNVYECVAMAQTAKSPSAAELKARSEYVQMLTQLQQGDLSFDFRAFRIAGAIVAGPQISMREVADRNNFKKFMADSNPQGALAFTNQTLFLDYASIIAHFDALMACRALSLRDEAAKHEKLLNALLDSMVRDGDGKSAESAYLAVTSQEEYIFMSLRLNLKPTGQQSSIKQNGHFYDLLKVIDPKTNTTRDLWFNVDVQMDPAGVTVPSSSSSKGNAVTFQLSLSVDAPMSTTQWLHNCVTNRSSLDFMKVVFKGKQYVEIKADTFTHCS